MPGLPLFVSFIVSIVCLITILTMRRPLRSLTWNSFVRLALLSFGAGAAIGYIALPTAWLICSYATKGGTIEENLCPGGDVKTLLGALVLGAIILTAWALKSYLSAVLRR